ncbi:MAG: methyltransferase domain-containing protein [Candidatus Eremiobacteraeota bacterium]|nr:methyltransferase domain-containing protein [Candidatus Eremiobacteraeota bacterium]
MPKDGLRQRRPTGQSVKRLGGDARSLSLRALLNGNDAPRVLREEIAAIRPPAVDRALATKLTHGTLKMRRALTWSVQRFLHQPFCELERPLQWTLLMGAYQLLYLRIPAHSAVNESVRLARASGHAGTAALANAVLRKLGAQGVKPPAPRPGDTPHVLALHASLPDWIAAHLVDRFGPALAASIASGLNEQPSRALRLSLELLSLASAQKTLTEEGFEIAQSRYGIPECLLVRQFPARGGVSQTWLTSGAAAWQSEQSQWAVQLLDPKVGETVVDVCAGRGVKTAMIAGRLGPTGRIYAIDDDVRKLDELRRAMSRRGLSNVQAVSGDARSAFPASVPVQADAVLVDAPCSALGLLGRRADVRWRKAPQDPARFAQVQRRILAQAATHVRPGGRMLYVTCSTDRREDEDVVDDFLSSSAEWEPITVTLAADGLGVRRVGPYVLTVPGLDGADGFFYASLHRRA